MRTQGSFAKRLVVVFTLTTAMTMASLPALAWEVRPISPPTPPVFVEGQPALISPKPVCCFVVW